MSVRATRRKRKEIGRKIGRKKQEVSFCLNANRQQILLTAERRNQLCAQGRVIAGLRTLGDLPQLPYVQSCGSSLVVIARRPAALLASNGVVLNRLTDPCSLAIVPPNTYIHSSLCSHAYKSTHPHTHTHTHPHPHTHTHTHTHAHNCSKRTSFPTYVGVLYIGICISECFSVCP